MANVDVPGYVLGRDTTEEASVQDLRQQVNQYLLELQQVDYARIMQV